MSAEKVALVYRVRGELPLPVVTADVGLQWNLPAECGVPFTFRQAIYEASFPVNGLRGAPRPPLQSPRPRGEIGASHCVRLRTPACGTAQLDATRPIPGTRPSGQRKRCSKLLPAILSCLGSPQSAIPGGLTLSSILRLTDFKRGLIGYSDFDFCF